MKSKIGRSLVFIYLSTLAASTILPLVYMFLTTFKTKDQYIANNFSLPTSFNLDNYRFILSDFNFLQLAKNSTLISLGAIVLSLLVTSMAGYAVAKLKFRGKKLLVLFIVSGMFMPGLVLILPVYQMLIKFNLVNSYLGLIIVYVASSVPFTTFMIVANLKGIPDAIIESAKIDGAGSWRVYWHIILPLLKPTLATVSILNFIGYWNELLTALIVLQDPAKKTVTIGVISLVNKFSSNVPLMYAGLFLSAIPVIVVFFIFMKQIINGVSSGAVK